MLIVCCVVCSPYSWVAKRKCLCGSPKDALKRRQFAMTVLFVMPARAAVLSSPAAEDPVSAATAV